MKCVSYAIFGYGKERNENCFDFHSYMRGLGICLRMNKLLYPDWISVVHTDTTTFEAFKSYFVTLTKSGGVEVVTCADAPLCKAMLWRMKPCFDKRFTHVICRDVDSPATYREVQCVHNWSFKDKAAHAITDSVSHNMPFMGGMIGFMPRYFSERTGWSSWETMLDRMDFPWEVKGTDQHFLCDIVYPKFAQPGHDSVTQHYILGHPNTFLTDCTNSIPSGASLLIDDEMVESNTVCGHIGSAGFYEPPMFRFLRKHWDKFSDILEAERLHPEVFYWSKEN